MGRGRAEGEKEEGKRGISVKVPEHETRESLGQKTQRTD